MENIMNFIANPVIIIPAGAAILASLLTVFISRWFVRSRPWVGISSIQRDDRFLVQIPEELIASIEEYWKLNSRNVPLKRLLQIYDELTDLIPKIKTSLEIIDEYQKNAVNRQRKDLIILLENSIFWSQLNRLNRRFALPIPESIVDDDIQPLLESADFTQNNIEEPSFLIETNKKKLVLVAGSGMTSAKTINNTRILGHVIKYWIEPYFSNIVGVARKKIQEDLHHFLELKERLSDLIMTRKLLINARIVNLGGEPEHISPYGMLNLLSGGIRIEPIPVVIDSFTTYEPGMEELGHVINLVENIAAKQGVGSTRVRSQDSSTPEYIVVRPGDEVAIELVTELPVNDNIVIEAIQKGMLSARLILERSNKKINKWIYTKPLVVGVTQNTTDRSKLQKIAEKRQKSIFNHISG